METMRMGRMAPVCVLLLGLLAAPAGAQSVCSRTLVANVVALDQPLTFNRLGAGLPGGMMFALQRDVCAPGGAIVNGQETCGTGSPSAGNVMLKPYKRPRPMVLRMNQGDCLKINFTNLLNPTAANGQTPTRSASVHAQGLELLNTAPSNCSGASGATCNDGSYVGQNPSGLAAPGKSATYNYFAAQEGTFLLYSTADGSVPSTLPNAGDGGTLAFGLFGAVHVQPESAEWYRSQVTAADLQAAGAGTVPTGQPKLSYQAVYSNTTSSPCYTQGLCRVGPVLNMLCTSQAVSQGTCQTNEIVHSDLTALITGPNAGRFSPSPDAELQSSYVLPDRLEPYREFTILYHEAFQTAQAFPLLYTTKAVKKTFGPGGDFFGFNYGMGGIGSEILANRLGVGPMGDCPECKYEEFFLTSWAVGDPAMLVDNPATNSCPTPTTGLCLDNVTTCEAPFGPSSTPAGCGICTPQYSCEDPTPATRAFFADDPSNVYHSYIGDHTKFRILHGGVDLHHLHHQHAHQWLHSPDSPTGDYTDSQSIGPGTGFTLEMVYNGSGNVNQTVGDSIFHCHFYPHFAAGMWALWRVHDVFEAGTQLGDDGRPVVSNLPGGGGQVTTARALPDGEITTGTPIPAVVPLPTIPMAPLPAQVWLTNGGTQVSVCGPVQGQNATGCLPALATSNPNNIVLSNPGYPFFIPGVAGHRAPHPPMDFAYACQQSGQVCDPDSPQCGSGDTCAPLDGGLPRHLITGCGQGTCTDSLPVNLTDFSKTLVSVQATQLPESGTVVEQTAMGAHSNRFVPSSNPDGGQTTVNAWNPSQTRPSNFVYNGLPPVQGAPYADPCIQYDLDGGAVSGTNRRYYAADIQLDVTFNQEGWHFPQQRMLSLWGDVQSYLSGAKAPEPLFVRANSGDCVDYALANLVPNVYELDDFQVRTPTDIIGQHIHLVKFDVTSSDGATNGFNYEDGTFSPNEVTERIRAINQGGGLAQGDGGQPVPLTAEPLPFFGPGPGGRWMGAQATIQRWYADPLFDGRSTTPGPGTQDRTLRTVFTHDHFGPSTHQQAGLYAGVVVEPPGSKWYFNETTSTTPFGGQGIAGRSVTGANGVALSDGGPTTWQAVIVPGNTTVNPAFREFLVEIQDSTLTYLPFGVLPSTSFGGFCSNTGAACTPATAVKPASGCASGAICYAYGFCSNDVSKSCKPGTWNSAEDVSNCGYPGATCNFVAGVPGQNFGSSNLASWGTTPVDPLGGNPAQAELITLAAATNNFSYNYRNEPFFPRITNSQTGVLNTGNTGDLSYVYASLDRGSLNGSFCSDNLAPCSSAQPCSAGNTCDPGGFCSTGNQICTAKNKSLCGSGTCNVGGSPYPALTQGVQAGDPFTPLMRAYAGDNVQVRVLMGAHINPHNLAIHGLKWLMEPSFVDSGWRNSQVMGISEHFELVVKLPPAYNSAPTSDFLFQPGAAAIEQAGGNWGLLRSYGTAQSNLQSLSPGSTPAPATASSVCPSDAAQRTYSVVATTVQQATGGALFYNNRSGAQVQDPNAIVYLNLSDLSCPSGQSFQSCTLKQGLTLQPLVLRAAAGDCVQVTLYNAVKPSSITLTGASSPVLTFPASQTSTAVGLHPQLLQLDVRAGDGANVGTNPTQTVAACTSGTCSCASSSAAGVNCASYTWYAGNYDPATKSYFPIEFGATNLQPSDSINHFQHGLFGALIVEPAGSTWQPLSGSAASYTAALVTPAAGSPFKEFVLVTQDGLPAYLNSGSQPPVLGGDNVNALNYGTEILYNGSDNSPWRSCTQGTTASNDVSCWLSSQASFCCSQTDGNGTCQSWNTACGDPQTPVFQACVGDPVRIRLLHAGGVNTNNSFELHGHVWSEAPYRSQTTPQTPQACAPATTWSNLQSSATIADDNLCSTDELSVNEWQGAKVGIGPGNHFDVLIDQAGGTAGVAGDYLFRSYPGTHYNLGNWGILRVLPTSNAACQSSSSTYIPAATAASVGGAGR